MSFTSISTSNTFFLFLGLPPLTSPLYFNSFRISMNERISFRKKSMVWLVLLLRRGRETIFSSFDGRRTETRLKEIEDYVSFPLFNVLHRFLRAKAMQIEKLSTCFSCQLWSDGFYRLNAEVLFVVVSCE